MRLPARITSYIVAGLIVAVLTVYAFGRLDQLISGKDAATTAASKAQLQVHAGFVRERAKRQAAERALVARGRTVAGLADSLAQLAQAADAADSTGTVSPWRAIAELNRTAYQVCTTAYTSCDVRAASAEAEADSLHRALAAQVKVRHHPCGVVVGIGVAAGQGVAYGAALVVGCQVLRFPWP